MTAIEGMVGDRFLYILLSYYSSLFGIIKLALSYCYLRCTLTFKPLSKSDVRMLTLTAGCFSSPLSVVITCPCSLTVENVPMVTGVLSHGTNDCIV